MAGHNVWPPPSRPTREQARQFVRSNPSRFGTNPPTILRGIATALDSFPAGPFRDRLNGEPNRARPWHFSAERLRIVAETIETTEKDTQERLAKAGEEAARTHAECDRLRGLKDALLQHTTRLREINETLRRDNMELVDEQAELLGERDKAISAAKVQRSMIDSLTSQLIDVASNHGDEVEIVFSYGAERGITPGQASDLALSFINPAGCEKR